MKESLVSLKIILIIFSVVLFSCDKVVIEKSVPPLPRHEKDPIPDYPVQVGTIRAYFGDYYKVFSQHIEKVQPVDSFSNIYFYGSCHNELNQINLIRCDSVFVLAMYIMGYPLDSLPATMPVPAEYGKYTEIDFYPFMKWNWGDPGHYSMSGFYGQSLFITDRTDDILTGTFGGTMVSSNGDIIPVTDGEFKIKIFRRYSPCGNDTIVSGGK